MYENNVPGTTPFVPGSTTPGAVGGPIPGTVPGFAPSAAPNPFSPPVAPAPAPGPAPAPHFSTAPKPVQNCEPDTQDDLLTPNPVDAGLVLDPREMVTIKFFIIPVIAFSEHLHCIIEGKLIAVENFGISSSKDFKNVVSCMCKNQEYLLLHMGKPTLQYKRTTLMMQLFAN